MGLQPTFGEHTINEFTLMFRNRQINLEPGFQRQSVWTLNDRRRLIQSVVAGYPLPSVFLYQRSPRGRLTYDVIDGKQRLETILMFTRVGRFKRSCFEVKLDLGDGDEWCDWRSICKHNVNLRAAFDSYKMQTVEVTGDLNQIADLFVRINSTGKRLTSAEKRNAKFLDNKILKEAQRLVGKFNKYLKYERVLSPAQISRMKGTELFAELLMSISERGPINKKTSLDRAIGNQGINGNVLARLSREFVNTMNRIKKVFPDLRQTRFRNSAEFYSLFLLVWEMEREKLVLTEKKRNKIASELLRKLSTGVDELREQLRNARPAKTAQKLYSDYLLTVQGDTDSKANRDRRREILRNLLVSLYDRKDDKRSFSQEQRRIIWNSDEKRHCARCHRVLTWANFTVDHKFPYAKGGKASLRNAQLMCRPCNSSKGAN
jgi:hypothetical protein